MENKDEQIKVLKELAGELGLSIKVKAKQPAPKHSNRGKTYRTTSKVLAELLDVSIANNEVEAQLKDLKSKHDSLKPRITKLMRELKNKGLSQAEIASELTKLHRKRKRIEKTK